ncbi:MAG: hypothetical protein K5654_02685 [Lachnospiraceae bacterium]|nr:hypothetical protein [Lachnospiraceae bacterium]
MFTILGLFIWMFLANSPTISENAAYFFAFFGVVFVIIGLIFDSLITFLFSLFIEIIGILLIFIILHLCTNKIENNKNLKTMKYEEIDIGGDRNGE